MTIQELEQIAADGESETVEFKKSTAQLPRAGEALCAFLNGQGGRVFIGVTEEGRIVGQQVSDGTLREIAVMLARFEPPALVSQERISLSNGREVLVLAVPAASDTGPFTYDGRPYHRVGSTTLVTPQPRYEGLLLQRAHVRSRWENTPAPDVGLKDLDREEILRTVRLGIDAGRLPESTGRNTGDILDRLSLRKDGQILNSAVILFGKPAVFGYPQRKLRLARFKGMDKTEFLDNRQPEGHAFALLDDAMTFLHRHLPISGRFEPGRLERIDELLFPTAALREALVNALCHRDYAIWGGAVSVAIFDDRVEIWSDGTLPFGIRPDDLTREHASKPRNPDITNVFYRRGLIEQWGRGTNRIVELTTKAGHPAPKFEEIAGSLIVRFRPKSRAISPQTTDQTTPEVAPEVGTKSALSRHQVEILRMCLEERALVDVMNVTGRSDRTKFRHQVLHPLIAEGLLEMTVPDKPRSRLQKYRLTAKGRAWLESQRPTNS